MIERDFNEKVTKLKSGFFEDVGVWYETNDIPNIILRLWTKEKLEPDAEFPECDFVYITQIIKISDDDYLIGYQYHDDRYDGNKFPYVDWAKLSEVELAYSESDQE